MAANKLLSNTDTAPFSSSTSSAAIWTGRIISGLVIVFMIFDSVVKILETDTAVEGSADLGYPASLLLPLGLTLLACTVLYAIPRTAVLGAILLTSYLGGAIATNVRLEDVWFVFPLVFGVLVWVGLYLRDNRVRSLLAG